jgi:mRNA interferase RelE/StbE
LKTSYKVKYSKKSVKFIKSNKIIGIKFFEAFDKIASNPLNVEKYDIKQLKNSENFRLRISKYRAIFYFENEELIIKVIDIGSRGQIYKN